MENGRRWSTKRWISVRVQGNTWRYFLLVSFPFQSLCNPVIDYPRLESRTSRNPPRYWDHEDVGIKMDTVVRTFCPEFNESFLQVSPALTFFVKKSGAFFHSVSIKAWINRERRVRMDYDRGSNERGCSVWDIRFRLMILRTRSAARDLESFESFEKYNCSRKV